MSKNDTLRELEELRALADKMSAARKKPKSDENMPGTGDVEAGAPLDTVKGPQKSTSAPQHFEPVESKGATEDFAHSPSARIAHWSLIIAVVLAILIVGRDFLVPVAVALMLRTLFNSMADYFGRIKIGGSPIPKWLAWAFSLVSLVLANALVFWILVSQSDALDAAAPIYQANFAKAAEKFATFIGIESMPSTAELMNKIDLGAVLSWLSGSVGSILNEFVMIAIYVGFLLAEQRYFPHKIARLSSDEKQAAKNKILMGQIAKQVQTYMGIKTVVSLITGVISYIILQVVGVDFAAVWGLIIFLLNYIPAVGSAFGVILPALLTLLQFETLTPFVSVVVGLGATQFIVGNVVEPAMMGSSLNLSSFVIMLSLTFWGMIWGVAGMVLCVPITVIVAIVCSHFERLRWIAIVLSSDGRLMDASDKT